MAFIQAVPLRTPCKTACHRPKICAKASSPVQNASPSIKPALVFTLSVATAALLITQPVRAISLPSLPSLPSIPKPDMSSADKKGDQTDVKDSSSKFTDEQETKVDDMMAKLKAKDKMRPSSR